jgi:hypothetical protein
MNEVLTHSLSPLGVGAVVAIAFVKYGGELFAKRVKSDHKSTLDMRHEVSKRDVDLLSKLWAKLVAVRRASDVLWEHATRESLASFAKPLGEAEPALEDARPFVDKHIADQLEHLLESLLGFKIGKEQLITVRRLKSTDHVEDFEVQNLIARGGAYRQQYSALMKNLEDDIRKRTRP